MKERLFFFAQDEKAAKAMIGSLETLGLEESDLHVIANDRAATEPLPEADLTHRSDVVDAAKLGAATGGALGLLGGVLVVTVPPAGLTLGGGALLAGTALGSALGTWFSTLVGVSVPNQDVEQYRQRIDAGEVMIIVDATEDQRQLLTTLMQQRYPDTLLLQGNLDAA